MRRIPQLDGLRGIAIGLVLLHHFVRQLHPPMREWLSAVVLPVAELGWSGVDLFFVLSGFLIGGILVEARESPNYYRTFYIRRAFRILPLYLVLVFIGILLNEIAAHSSGAMSGLSLHLVPWPYYFTFTQNFYFATHTDLFNYLQITWSLAVEEQFYLTLPVLVRKINVDKLLGVSIGMVAFFGLLRSVLYWQGHITAMQSYMLPFCRFDSLFIGVACALLMRKQSVSQWLEKHPWPLIAVTTLSGGVFLFMDHYLWSKNVFLHTAGFTIIGIFYTCVVMWILLLPQSVLSHGLRYQPLMWLGVVSYCVYLIHGLMLTIANSLTRLVFEPSDLQLWAAAILGAVLIAVVSWGSWVLFESRMIDIGHRFAYERKKTLEPAANQA